MGQSKTCNLCIVQSGHLQKRKAQPSNLKLSPFHHSNSARWQTRFAIAIEPPANRAEKRR